jgi:hypothetical protein
MNKTIQSTIAFKRKDGAYLQIYCFINGDLQHNGVILLNHFNDEKSIQNLLKLGNLFKLGPLLKPSKSVVHTFKNPAPNVCIAYGRDRGRATVEPQYYANSQQFIKYRMFRQFNYLFVKNMWMVNGQSLVKALENKI